MRGYALAASALGAFFLGLALELAGIAFPGLDLVVAVLFGTGAGAALVAYLREKAPRPRKVAVIGLGLNAAGLILLVAALR